MMPLENLLCGLLETGLNKLQRLDQHGLQRRKMLDGKIVGVMPKELNKPLYFIIDRQQIDISNEFAGQTDCFIRFNLSALKELQDNHQLTHLIKSEQLEIEGDTQLAQQFAQLLMAMEIDWEEQLSAMIGDVFAHKLCYYGKSVHQKVSAELNKIKIHHALFITDEAKLAPGSLEVAHFCEQVDEISRKVQHLEKRIHQAVNR